MAGPDRGKLWQLMEQPAHHPLDQDDIQYLKSLFEYFFRSGYLGSFTDDTFWQGGLKLMEKLQQLSRDQAFWNSQKKGPLPPTTLPVIVTHSAPLLPKMGHPKSVTSMESFTL